MTQIRGVWGAVDDVGDPYRNNIEDVRAMLWEAVGAAQGVLSGFDMSLDSGSLSVTFTAGQALVEERGTDITGDGRGYHVFNDVETVVVFEAPDAASRSDALVFAWADPQYGALGASVDAPGPQVVVVRGVSGSTTPRTDVEINDEIGPGGWFRYADVQIDPADTEVDPANVTTTFEAVGAGRVTTEVFTADGTWTKPLSAKSVRVRVVGGGGAGGGAQATTAGICSTGSGGGGGAYGESTFDADELADTEPVLVGAGGTGVSGNDGNAGGTSSFGASGTLVSAGGGQGGIAEGAAASAGSSSRVGDGGAVGTAQIASGGQAGSAGARVGSSSPFAGTGGSSTLGGGGGPTASTGADGKAYGGGGGGSRRNASSSALAGGAGADGVVIVTTYR